MTVEATTERVLRLLSLLQSRPCWTAAELAAALAVTDRSVRRDVQRLRSLGYPVHAVAGVGGGYQLGAGSRLPPLLFDDEEAVAVAVSVRMAAGGTVSRAGEAALRALAKLDQVMPPRLRAEIRAVHGATEMLVAAPGVEIDPELLVTLARACRDRMRVRFRYPVRTGGEQERTVEPLRMVTTGRRWYLMAFDVDRADWRTFRLDRMREVTGTTWRFPAREHPDPVAYVHRSVAEAPYPHLARVRLQARPEQVRELVPPQVGRVEEDRDGWCLLIVGGEHLDWLAAQVARLGFPAQVLDPPELRQAAARLARRLAAMADPGGVGQSAPPKVSQEAGSPLE